ncbi:hypothetical protein K493DRAFT_285259 [Basidiobolus meristosporus CBS 931.73]|uniref:Presequence protease, mitochondrial n=1 Tax=Basidiobolus meristosporus CBS 931.73 TaxID=1314790 RepID=A0A1Y1Y4I6_9FUNG|nr:hypothetical protein K493DRAFT_285259 [Basidiobolus meristosporus CBS 931.73]|eukprot:ORX92907.1 hypothetical protein K493DRAFT_285259 [Basidiobolus meristosporus CBS 931.73]
MLRPARYTASLVSSRLASINASSYTAIRLVKKFHSQTSYEESTFVLGETVHGFKVEEVREVREFRLTAIKLNHEKTGAEYLHLGCDDRNNVFSVGFSTPPTDDTGAAHILEHTVLCSSEKYPIRDPYFKMANRSLSTFMNALTECDYTHYPFSTQNLVDYNNLRDVFLDAVFAPKLLELDFLQEGWRIENEFVGNPHSPLVFKGVVYNEMKGALADPGTLFYCRAQQKLFPGTAYGYIAGGDPQHITDLTHENLLKFHQRYYHPTNAKFYSYGRNFPLESQLKAIDRKISHYSRVHTQYPNQTVERFTSPQQVTVAGPYDSLGNPNRQIKLSMSYLIDDFPSAFDHFSMKILSALLLDGPASPMHQALIDSDLGTEYSTNVGYNTTTKTSSFSAGLQGVRYHDIDLVENSIQMVLERAHGKGFSRNRIDSILHPVELGSKNKTGNFGLALLQTLSASWFHGRNPIDELEIDQNLKRIKQLSLKGGFFRSKIEKYLLKNPHRLTFVMQPDVNYTNQLLANERQRLEKIASSLTGPDKARIFQRGLELRRYQDIVEDVSCLPSLSLSDIPVDGEETPLDHDDIDGVPVQWCSTSANGISYLRIISPLPDLPEDLKPYLPLFCDALTFLGTRFRTMAEIDQEIRLYTGGISFAHFLACDHSDIDKFEEGISLSSYVLDRHIPKLYKLVLYLIKETDFENVDALEPLISSNASTLLASVPYSGHVYAKSYAASSLSSAAKFNEIANGLTQVEFAGKLANNISTIESVAKKLKSIQSFIFKKESIRIAINGTPEGSKHHRKYLANFLSGLKRDANCSKAAISPTFSLQPAKSFIPLSFNTNFVAQCIKAVPYTHEDSAKLAVLANLLTQQFLHREIREKNGAYDGGAEYDASFGMFTFFSYRDPTPLHTLESIEKSKLYATGHRFGEKELTEAKLAIFGRLDSPVGASEEGLTRFITGISAGMRQRRRKDLLAVTTEDIQRVAEQYLLRPTNEPSSSILGEHDRARSMGWNVRNLATS